MKIKKIALALREAKTSLRTITLFNCVMDTSLLIMICLLAAKLLTLPWWSAFIPGAIYATIHTTTNMNRATYNTIEKKFPQLDEQLITAADNWKQDNIVVDALNEEVLEKMKQVQTIKDDLTELQTLIKGY